MDNIPIYPFWRDGCSQTMWHTCKTLRGAGEPITPSNVLQFIKSLPWEKGEWKEDSWRKNSYAFWCVMEIDRGTEEGSQTWHALNFACEHFRYLISRPPEVRGMLIETFIGVLEFFDCEPRYPRLYVSSSNN